LKPDISVVICAYTEERWNDLVQVVQSIRRQIHAPREIILVVDHNPKLLARVHAEIDGVIAMENAHKPGLRGGRNTGLARASAEVIAFLDDDAVAEPDWLERLAEGYDSPKVLGVGGAPRPDWLAGRPAWFPAEFNWVVGCAYQGMPEFRAPVRNLFGCNMSFRREAFDTVGGFRLGYSCDETEFCIRAHQVWPDRVLMYEPAAVVNHKVPASRATWRYLLKRCYFEGGSKAVVTWLVGAQDGLASERAHVFRTLPIGVARAVADAVVHRDPAGLARAAAIVLGLAATMAGYVTGRLSIQAAARERGYAPLEQAAV
jgi:glucosyl-dolichyl phosphate glucuronosyltransferase